MMRTSDAIRSRSQRVTCSRSKVSVSTAMMLALRRSGSSVGGHQSDIATPDASSACVQIQETGARTPNRVLVQQIAPHFERQFAGALGIDRPPVRFAGAEIRIGERVIDELLERILGGGREIRSEQQ